MKVKMILPSLAESGSPLWRTIIQTSHLPGMRPLLESILNGKHPNQAENNLKVIHHASQQSQRA